MELDAEYRAGEAAEQADGGGEGFGVAVEKVEDSGAGHGRSFR
jgi:hypothetical protein